MKYQVLNWDSNFFGFKVAYILLTEVNELKLNNLLALLKQKDFTLVYVSSMINIDNMLRRNFGRMVDEKVTYIKSVDRNLNIVENIVNYELKYPTEQMLKLAVESGVYSRFNLDKRIGKDKYEELYKMWITNSANHSIAKNVIVYKEHENILGMLTLSEKNGRGNIGIIAVDSNARGKGIGTYLMKAAEKWAHENYYNEIQVVTQDSNMPACNLYEKIGFSIEKKEYYYHFWLKKES